MTSDVVGGMAGVRGASGQAGLGNGWLAWTRRRFRQVWEVKRAVLFLVLLLRVMQVGVGSADTAGRRWQWQPVSLRLAGWSSSSSSSGVGVGVAG